GGDDGGDHGDREPPRDRRVTVCPGLHDGQRARQRVHGGDLRPLPVGARRDRIAPPGRDGGCECARALPGLGGGRPREGSPRVNAARRRVANIVMAWLSFGAAVLSIAPLILILAFLVYQGASSVNLDFFIHLPKPVGEPGGGMANAIVGSIIMIGLASS